MCVIDIGSIIVDNILTIYLFYLFNQHTFAISIGSNIMNLNQLYKCFPSQKDCIILLEEVRWRGLPTCPYCKSKKQTSSKTQKRYHCNTCNTSYSVTVGTFLGNTKLDLQKWFKAILLITGSQKEISSRELANEINVTKDTALLMIQRFRKARTDFKEFLDGLIQEIERVCYEM